MRNWRLGLGVFLSVALLLTACAAPPQATKEPYKVGVTAAMTGPFAVSYAPWVEGTRIYFQRLNERGGIDGHPVQAMFEDDRGEGARATANVKKFAEQGASLLLNLSPSGTYGGTVAEAKTANIPAIFQGIAPDEAKPPNPQPLIFHAGGGTPGSSAMPAVKALKEIAPGTKMFGFLGVNIPLSRLQVETGAKLAKDLGMDALVKVVPPGTADLTPVASSFIEAKADVVYFTGAGGMGIALFDALDKLGWKGPFLNQGGDAIELSLERMKRNENFHMWLHYIPFPMPLPEHQEILDAAKKYGVTEINSTLIWGWLTGKVAEQVYRKAGWPANTEKLLRVMTNLPIERAPLMGNLIWIPQDHAGTSTYAAFYWDQKKGQLVVRGGYWQGSADGSKIEKLDRMK